MIGINVPQEINCSAAVPGAERNESNPAGQYQLQSVDIAVFPCQIADVCGGVDL